jgi:O-succinylbenzoic acid--CoA ligase
VSSVWVPHTITEVLDRALERTPDAVAIIGSSGQLSYAELEDSANAHAMALAARGVRTGDRVAACLPNDLDIVVLFHAVMRLGAVWVGVNRALAVPEKHALITDCGPRVLLGDETITEELGTHIPSCSDLIDVVNVLDVGWRASVTEAHGSPRAPLPDPRAPAGIAYTSGTTGVPKGVVHSQANLLLPGAATVASRGYGPALRKGDCLPLTILNMMALTTLLVAQAGGTCVLSERRYARGIAEWIEREAITVWNGVPAMLHDLADDDAVSPESLGSLAEVWSGGSDCPNVVRGAFERKFSQRVYATYGLTEAPSLVAIEPLGEPHAPNSSGRPLPHLKLDILTDDGTRLGPGQLGEICVDAADEGPWAGLYRPMLGYWAGDVIVSDARSGLPLRTGDLGIVDGNGNLCVRDRKKLVIVRGGANVYPAEVERVLMAYPGVCGCVVLGLPHDRLGQCVVAVVQVMLTQELDADNLIAFCRERLAQYKVPEKIRIVDALPRNAMGKAQRDRLAGLFN